MGAAPKSDQQGSKTPQDTRIYAVGDIHGRVDLLEQLHEKIIADAQSHQDKRLLLIYLGDYVDRGPESKAVIDLLLNDPLPNFEILYLKGNHEVFFEHFLANPRPGTAWLMNGGEATCLSYGVDYLDAPDGSDRFQWLHDELHKAVPKSHQTFLASLALSHSEGDYFFVHAGVRPNVPLAAQKEADLLWIRELFVRSKQPFEKVVVHGHTPVDEPDNLFNRIGVDTGACYGGNLTAVVLDGEQRSFLKA
ncbi:metallophosphoesterase family protein [Rhodovibrionaceae bacterium A322]